MAKAIAVTKLGVVGGTVYNVGNYVLEATIADAVVAAGLATITQADVPDDIDLSTPEAILNAMGDTPSLVIASASVTTKPSSPNEKDVYIVPAGSAWAALDEAYDNQLAMFERGGWKYITPKFGWQIRNKADNGVLWYDGDSWEVSGSGGGTGTVTSVGLSLPNIFTISGSPVTTSGTLSATLANQSANQIFAGPSSGGAATPSFRSLVIADIPDISSVYATKAYADGLVVGLLDDRGNFDASSNTFPAAAGSGSGGAVLKGDLWTISVAGTLGGTAVTPGDIVRALVDTPGQTASNWAVSETNIGYTALNAALNSGQIYVGNSSNVGTARTLSGDVTVNNTGVTAIGNAKVTNAMLAGSIDLAAKVTGVLPMANGGTGLSALGSALQVLRVNAGGTALEYAAASGGVAAGDSPTWTGLHTFNSGVTTGTGASSGTVFAFNSLTTGVGANFSSSSVTSGSIVNIASTSTAGATGVEGLNIAMSGANGTSGQTVTGATISVTNTNATSGTNKALVLTASGATTLNTALEVTAGRVLLPGSGTAASPQIVLGSTTSGAIYSDGSNFGVAITDNTSGANLWVVGASMRVKSGMQIGWTSSSTEAISGLDTGQARLAAAVIRLTNGSTGAGSLVLGTSTVGSIGTSGVGVLAIANGTAPGSSPADTGQIYAADWNGAGTSAIHIRNEEGHIFKICSQAVNAITNNVTSGGTDDTIANFSDLSVYATDANAIRNNIYQLARKLGQVTDALRTNGLLR